MVHVNFFISINKCSSPTSLFASSLTGSPFSLGAQSAGPLLGTPYVVPCPCRARAPPLHLRQSLSATMGPSSRWFCFLPAALLLAVACTMNGTSYHLPCKCVPLTPPQEPIYSRGAGPHVVQLPACNYFLTFLVLEEEALCLHRQSLGWPVSSQTCHRASLVKSEQKLLPA